MIIPVRDYSAIFCLIWEKYSRTGNVCLHFANLPANITVQEDQLGPTMLPISLPYGKISNTAELGRLIQQRRKQDGLTQAQFAALCNVGTRLISELENGKQTIEFGKILQVLAGLGIELYAQPRTWRDGK